MHYVFAHILIAVGYSSLLLVQAVIERVYAVGRRQDSALPGAVATASGGSCRGKGHLPPSSGPLASITDSWGLKMGMEWISELMRTQSKVYKAMTCAFRGMS